MSLHGQVTVHRHEPSRWQVLWCQVTLRHKGHVDHDRKSVFWRCDRCGKLVR